jgi:hypothetical protein
MLRDFCFGVACLLRFVTLLVGLRLCRSLCSACIAALVILGRWFKRQEKSMRVRFALSGIAIDRPYLSQQQTKIRLV